MSALLESLATGFHGSADQRRVLDSVLRDGLPGARSEAWKYTSLRALERRTFGAVAHGPPAVEMPGLAHIPAPRLVFVNGRFDARQSDGSHLPEGVTLRALSQEPLETPSSPVPTTQDAVADASIFARLALVLAGEGVVLQVDGGIQIAAPIHLVHIGAASGDDIAWHARHRIELGARARLAIVEHHLHADEHANLENVVTGIRLGAGASLLHAHVQDESPRATLIVRTQVTLEAGAYYQRVDLELGAALSRHELNVDLEGDGARVSANGVLLATGRRHVDTRLGIEHAARDTSCDLVWRGLAAGRGRAVLHGGIVINAGADGSDARLANKNLLLSEGAEIDTQPVLEIHADEVKAAHGATVGQLDPTAMFYLRSRGLNESDARQLLTTAFCRDVIVDTFPASIRETLTHALDRALSAMGGA